MRKSLGTDGSGGHALEPIVAHGGGGSQSFICVAGLEDTFARHVIPPDAGIAVGLELAAHRFRVGRSEGIAQQRLDMMSDLVREHVGLSDVSGCAEPLAAAIFDIGTWTSRSPAHEASTPAPMARLTRAGGSS